jgi:hypothetical protein
MISQAYGMVMCFYEFVEKIIKKFKKIIWRKIVAIHNILKEKTTKLNFQPA